MRAVLIGALVAATLLVTPPAGADDPPVEPPPAQPTTLTVTGTWSVIDEHSRRLTAEFRTVAGTPVAGARLGVYARLPQRPWRLQTTAVTGADGRATFMIAPRYDVELQVNGAAGTTWLAASSTPHLFDNRPQVAPVRYPRAAPVPRERAAQPRATTPGANAVITGIPDEVWASMRGRSWHPGCPVGRSSLRLIRINYWDFTGYRRRGEMVVNASIAARAAAALTEMYNRRFPIRRMYRVDLFGWSRTQQGANDRASMAADNTSAFNCRSVTGWPGRRSPHSYGRSIDLNPFENPFVSRAGVLPNRWWLHHSDPRIAWRSGNHPVVRIWRKHGFHWSYPASDPQHWDGRLGGAGRLTFRAD